MGRSAWGGAEEEFLVSFSLIGLIYIICGEKSCEEMLSFSKTSGRGLLRRAQTGMPVVGSSFKRYYGWESSTVAAEVGVLGPLERKGLVALSVDYASGGGQIPSPGHILGARIAITGQENSVKVRPALILYSVGSNHVASLLPDDLAEQAENLLEGGQNSKLRLKLSTDAAGLAGSHKPGWLRRSWDAVQVVEDTADDDSEVFCDPPGPSDRKVIYDGLVTGVLAVDTMTPIGRGQSMLISGREGYGMRALGDCIARIAPLYSVHDLFTVYAAASKDDAIAFRDSVDDQHNTLVVGGSIKEGDDDDVSCMIASYASCAIAEVHRNKGGHSLLVLSSLLQSHLRVWQRGQNLLKSKFSGPELRAYYSPILQRAAQLNDIMGGGSLTAVATFDHGIASEEVLGDDDHHRYSLEDFADRPTSELRRLGFLASKDVPLTAASLSKIGIHPPATTQASVVIEREHVEELKSLSDGHISLSRSMISKGIMPALDPRRSLTRIGIGTNVNRVTDTRPLVLRRTAGPLRLEMAQEMDEMNTKGARLGARLASLKQTYDAPLEPEEQAALLYAVSSGLFDRSRFDSEESYMTAIACLEGGSKSKLMCAIKSSAGDTLESMKQSQRVEAATDGEAIIRIVKTFVEQ